MTASIELVIIGDELLEGRISDLNGPWLSRYAHRQGARMRRMTIVSDDLPELVSALREAHERSDLVITCGGLGPTSDDRAREALKTLINAELVDDPRARAMVLAHYQRIDRTWSEETNTYNLVPEGVTPLSNPSGLAPGLKYQTPTKSIMMLPGVPREFKAMAEVAVLEELRRLYPSIQRKTSLTIRTVGVAEEKIFTELMPTLWSELERFGKLSSLPQHLGVDLVLTPREEVDYIEWVDQVRSYLATTKLMPHVWQWGEQELAPYLVDILSARGANVSFAESCTGGLLSSLITDVPGSSRVFPGSLVSYANEVKIEELGVDPKIIEAHGAVSLECAKAMALGAKLRFKTDFALGLSGIAGPGGGSPEKPVGTLALGWVTPEGVADGELVKFHGNRFDLKQRFATKAMFKLLRLLS
jgi:nicotinamide-nucleotide amidase